MPYAQTYKWLLFSFIQTMTFCQPTFLYAILQNTEGGLTHSGRTQRPGYNKQFPGQANSKAGYPTAASVLFH